MKRKNENYEYLLYLYSFVDDHLSKNPTKHENFPNVLVSFCIVTEKIFKIKLHNKNPILAYDVSKIKETDALITVIKEKELDIETINIWESVKRFDLTFEGVFSAGEIQSILDIYYVRNHFVHGFRPDNKFLLDSENLIKKMGTVWEKISTLAVAIFGRDLIKANRPKTKYSEDELEKVLTEEVKKKIISPNTTRTNIFFVYPPDINKLTVSPFNVSGEKCPRCGSYSFSLESLINPDSFRATVNLLTQHSISDLYKCTNCHLELTRKEYEIAKKITPGLNETHYSIPKDQDLN